MGQYLNPDPLIRTQYLVTAIHNVMTKYDQNFCCRYPCGR